MDEVTRGFIEKSIDKMLEFGVVDPIKWVEEGIPIQSMESLALGYIIGGITTSASLMTSVGGGHRSLTDEDKLGIRKIIKRRLPEITTKIKAELNGYRRKTHMKKE